MFTEALSKPLRASIVAALALCALQARAELASVEAFDYQCGWVLIKTQLGYSLGRQITPSMVTIGDTVSGEFERESREHQIKNTSNHNMMTLWIERFATDRATALLAAPAACNLGGVK